MGFRPHIPTDTSFNIIRLISFDLFSIHGCKGEYLGLTGARLDGYEMLASGLATHFVLSKVLYFS